MTGRYISSKLQRTVGFSTIELLIAFSIGMIFLTAAMLVSYNDSTRTRETSLNTGPVTVLDAMLDNDALATSSNKMGNILAKLTGNWNSTITSNADTLYTNTPTITDISPCSKVISNDTTWNTQGGRGRSLSFDTIISDIATARALGGDCGALPMTETWSKPRKFSSHNFNSSKPISIDVLNQVAYVTDDKGRLQIYDASSDYLNNLTDFSITPYADAANKQLNDVDVIKKGTQRYAFVTRNDTTNQFQVINVTTPGTYTKSSLITLGGSPAPSGSFPQGWRVFYYDNRVYVTTRETTGKEFHIFDATTPMSPSELGSAYEVNGTINDFFVTSVTISGTVYKLAFLATDRSANEVLVINVTNPSSPTQVGSIDLPAASNALSIQMLGNRLYVGRQNTSGGPELYVYTVTYSISGGSPAVTFTSLGSGAEIGSDVTSLRVVGNLAFIGSPSATAEFKVWDISHPATGFSRIDTSPINLSNKVYGLDYEAPYIYVVSQANDALQILYSAP